MILLSVRLDLDERQGEALSLPIRGSPMIGRRDERIDRINTGQFVGRKAEHLKGDVEKALQESCISTENGRAGQ
jgi:hypothetical protein